eukprot:280910_1
MTSRDKAAKFYNKIQYDTSQHIAIAQQKGDHEAMFAFQTHFNILALIQQDANEINKSSHIVLKLSRKDIASISANCTNCANNQCIVKSEYHSPHYEVNMVNTSQEICLFCRFFILIHTEYFQTILHFMQHPTIYNNKQSHLKQHGKSTFVLSICEILSNIVCNFQIRKLICKKQPLFKRLFRIFYFDGSCVLFRDIFCSITHCGLKKHLLYTIGYGFNKRLLKWFVNIDNSKYFKNIIIDEFEKMESQIKSNIHNVAKQYEFWLSVVLNIVKHYKYLTYSMNIYGNQLALINIGKVLKIHKSIEKLLPQSIEKRLHVGVRVSLRENIKCNNRNCNILYFKHMYGVSVHELNFGKEYNKVNKWYKCKQCQIAFYCSRRCQKYDWNIFGHAKLCQLL